MRQRKRAEPVRTLSAQEAVERLERVRAQSVQSLQAHRVADLLAAAAALGHRGLVADLSCAGSAPDLEREIGIRLGLGDKPGRKKGALLELLTLDVTAAAAAPRGWLLVLQHLPADDGRHDEAREALLDVLWDACEFWKNRGVAFRCFYSVAAPGTVASARARGFTEATLRMSNPFAMARLRTPSAVH